MRVTIYNKGLTCSYHLSFSLRSDWSSCVLRRVRAKAECEPILRQNCVLGRCAYLCSIVVLHCEQFIIHQNDFLIAKIYSGTSYCVYILNFLLESHLPNHLFGKVKLSAMKGWSPKGESNVHDFNDVNVSFLFRSAVLRYFKYILGHSGQGKKWK